MSATNNELIIAKRTVESREVGFSLGRILKPNLLIGNSVCDTVEVFHLEINLLRKEFKT
jgi:hypothetical protein